MKLEEYNLNNIKIPQEEIAKEFFLGDLKFVEMLRVDGIRLIPGHVIKMRAEFTDPDIKNNPFAHKPYYYKSEVVRVRKEILKDVNILRRILKDV
jgi:hypothetical protein